MNGPRRLATAGVLALVAGLPAASPAAAAEAITPALSCVRILDVGDRAAPEGTRVEETDPLYTYVSFPVTSSGCGLASTVSWSVQGVTASPTWDFVSAGGTVSFPAGSHATRWLTVRVVPDGSPGSAELYRVSLHSPSAGAVVDDGVGLGWILDDDAVCQPPPGWVPPPPHYPDYHCSE